MRYGVKIFWSIIFAAAFARVIFSLSSDKLDIGKCLINAVRGVGIISEDPSRKESGQVLTIDADYIIQNSIGLTSSTISPSEICAKDIRIRAKTKLYPRYSFGDIIEFSGKINTPYNFKSEDGRAFDYQGFLAKDDIYFEMKSAQITLVKYSSDDKSESVMVNENVHDDRDDFSGLTSFLYKIKRSFVNNLENSLGEPHAALAAGLVVGEKSALGVDLLNDFRTVGLIHIVVLSGFNITVVADAMRRLLSRLPRVWGIVIGGVGMILFGVLVGGGATVIRSCFMASLALFADLSRRDYNVIRALSFAALVMLIQNPDILLHDPSFQLSFLATAGLILLASPIEKKLSRIPEKFGIRGTVASTFATQIFVSPFILYTMGNISIIGVVVNILVLPFIPLTMLAVFLTGVAGFISGIIFEGVSQFFGWFAHLLLSYELFMVEKFAQIPYASLHFPKFSGWYVVAFYIIFSVVYFTATIWKQRQNSVQ